MQESSTTAGAGFEATVSFHRNDIKRQARELLVFMKHAQNAGLGSFPETADRNEMIANFMLAYRHLEDAAMRLGKVIQAHDGGVSVYDK